MSAVIFAYGGARIRRTLSGNGKKVRSIRGTSYPKMAPAAPQSTDTIHVQYSQTSLG